MNKINVLSLITPKKQVAYLDDKMSLRQALEKMKAHGYAAIPLLKENTGEYLGTISEGDLLWYIVENEKFELHNSEDISIKKIVRGHEISPMSIDCNIDEVLERVTTQNFIPIVDDRGILMGIVTRRSILNYIKNNS